MQIHRFFVFIVTIAFIIVNCNPVFSSDNISVMSEVFYVDDGEIDVFEQKLKSPQNIDNAPVIKCNDDNLKTQQKTLSQKDDIAPPQIGFAKYIDSLSNHKRLKKTLNWLETQDGGHTATIIISSPEAAALRVGIIVKKLPQETEFRFFTVNSGTPGLSSTLIRGAQINKLLVLNKEVDSDHPDSQTYWSPTVAGESMGIEISLPPGSHPDNFDIAIPFLSHIFVSPFISRSKSLKPLSYGESYNCQNDASCYSGWNLSGNAVALMVFTQSGYSYECTGTLLNDKDSSSDIPYFITANHCINTQTVASTLETHWFFESASCNSSIRNLNYTTRSGGAKLLWTKGLTKKSLNSNQDVSFLELNDIPPSGVTYAGWNSTIDSNTVTGIHHPSGDWKKISFGSESGDYKCYDVSDDSFYCTPVSNGNFVEVIWSDGGIESGSSGSGIFNSNDQLIGTLLGGEEGCAWSVAYYSKFSAAYSAGNLSQWLNAPPCTYTISPGSGSFPSSGGTNSVSVTASNHDCRWTASETLSWVNLSSTSGTGSGTISVTITANTGDARTGSIIIAGKTYTISQSAVPIITTQDEIYRFFNTKTGTHFYTSSVEEKNYILNIIPYYNYEGVAFYGTSDSNATNVSPVYRFYNNATGTHFYTISNTEKDYIVSNFPNFSFEGKAYSAFTSNISGTIALYRFYNTQTGTHFYTASEIEKSNVQNNHPQYNYEGIAYYVGLSVTSDGSPLHR